MRKGKNEKKRSQETRWRVIFTNKITNGFKSTGKSMYNI